MNSQKYVHGYSEREASRLRDQAETLTELLHSDTQYAAGRKVLEAGCGIGAQTITLAANSPEAEIVSIDVSPESLEKARELARAHRVKNVTFMPGDIFNLDFPKNSFDDIFVCFVLEHLSDPIGALKSLKKVLKPGGTITVIEGDHGSFYSYPESPESKRSVECLIRIQASLGGDSLVGRRLFPLLKSARFKDVRVSPRMVYVDSSRPRLVDGFSKKTFIAMVEGVEQQAIRAGLIDRETWKKGITDLYRATKADGTFCYTFFKALAVR